MKNEINISIIFKVLTCVLFLKVNDVFPTELHLKIYTKIDSLKSILPSSSESTSVIISLSSMSEWS